MKKIKKIFTLSIIVILIAAFLSSFSPFLVPVEEASASPDWYDSAWQYRREITIDHTKVEDVVDPSTTYADFPVLVYMTGLSNIKADGADIRFTLSDEVTEIPREIESYSGGTLYAWVKVTLTKDSSDTSDDIIYMYYGNDSATEPLPDSPYGSQNVWDTNFKGVWHMKDETSVSILDSTSNNNDGTKDAANHPSETDGNAGKAQNFVNADGDKIMLPDMGTVESYPFTFEAWFKTSTAGADPANDILSQTHISDYRHRVMLSFWGENLRYAVRNPYSGEVEIGPNSSSYRDNEWHYVVGVSSAANSHIFYIDGSENSSSTITVTAPSVNQSAIGYRTPTDEFDGIIDEARISNTARSAAWISTSYNNQNSPSTFIGFGPEEPPADTLYERYITGDDTYTICYGNYWKAQTFTIGNTGTNEDHNITSVKLKLFRKGIPGTLTVSIRAVDGAGYPTGEDLTSGTTNGNTLTISSSGEWREISLTSYGLSASTKYAIVIRISGGDSSNSVRWRRDGTSSTYTGGHYCYSSNSGDSWAKFSTEDLMFEEYGTAAAPPAGDWIGISSSHYDSHCGDDGSHTCEEALDDTDYWRHAVDETHWVILDLGQTYTIKKVRGRSDTLGDPIDVDIYVSDSKTVWGTAVATNITTWQDTTSWVEIDTTDKDGRYIKVVIVDVETFLFWKYLLWGSVASPFTIFDAYGEAAPSPNQPPTINWISDLPDPVTAGNPITFTVDWSDPDSGDQTKIHICKTDSISGQTCTGGSWCDTTSWSTVSPSQCSYITNAGDVGTSPNSYFAYVCDDDDACSGSMSGTFNVIPVSVCEDHNVQGWAWSENIGWISFSCESGGGTNNYGVDIVTTTAYAKFSGHAWSENIGWISFEETDLTGCPSGDCWTEINTTTGDVSGWARALAYGGGWDGWIHLRDTNYGVYASTVDSYSEFYDWAWGGDDSSSTAVVGWISFNCENTSCPYDYQVTTTIAFAGGANNPPIADFDCDPSACNSSDCIGYNDCPLVMINNSTDTDPGDTLTSSWYIGDGLKGDPCVGEPNSCNFVPANYLVDPDYESFYSTTVTLYVTDDQATDTASTIYEHRRNTIAGFRCSLDNSDWSTACGDFPPVEAGTVMYFKDNLLGDYPNDSSYPSCCGNTISTRTWKLNEVLFGENNSEASTTLSSFPSTIKLKVVDSDGREDETSHTISGKPSVPLWIEVSP